jgi:hypothetical protein
LNDLRTEFADGAQPALAGFLGIPDGWPTVLAIVALVLFLWMAREPARRVLWQAFFVTGRLFSRWGLWLGEHGRAARLATAERIAATRAEELADRMLVLEDRIGKRAEKLPEELGGLAVKLDTSAHSLETSAKALSGIDLNLAAERAVRSALPRVEEGRGVHKVHKAVGAVRVEMAEQVKRIRPELGVVKQEAPRLRQAAEKLAEVEGRFTKAIETVNKTFADYEECLRSPDRLKVAGKQSILVPWLIAMLVMMIAISGVFLNFFLIERPMSEIVGEGARIAGVGLPAFAAMIVIFLEFVAGVILMDAAGLTKLIPTFHTMSDRQRMILFWTAFLFLAMFSVLEASLALVRERIIEMNNSTRAAAGPLADAAAAAPAGEAQGSSNPAAAVAELSTFAQVVLAVLIPWLLATAALPLETIVRNTVFIVQLVGAYALLGASFVCKTLGNAFKSLGMFVLAIYDLVIFAPLWAERRIKTWRSGEPPPDRPEEPQQAKRDAPAAAGKPAQTPDNGKQPREMAKA